MTERMPTMPSRTSLVAPIALVLALVAVAPVAADTVPDLTPYLVADRAAEVALARSAAPKDVSGPARVLVMTAKGFVEAEPGTNGFTCLVLRSFAAPPADPNFWNPRVRAPHCFNRPGVRTVLPEILQRIEWILAGVSPTEAEARGRRGYGRREFPKPEPGAMAYMLSPQQHLQDGDEPHWMPHLMLYYDRSMKAADWGAGGMTAPVIDATAGDPQAPVITLLVPVSRWSDGTPFVPHAGH